MYKLNLQVLKLSQKACHFVHRVVNSVPSKLELNRSLNDLWKYGRIDEARQLFDKMSDRDEFTWNTMISAYAYSGRLNEAKQLFNETPLKSTITWNSLVSGFCRYGFEIEAFDMFWLMQFEGRRPDQYTLGSVLRLCSTLTLLLRGQQIHAYAIKTYFDCNDFVVTGLVDMYAKSNCILEAEYLFKTVPDSKNPVMWTAMVTGYSHNADGFKAIECFRDMREEGVEPNQYTFPSILTACAAVSAADFGAQVHGCIVRSGFNANTYVQCALVDMYAKCRDLETAWTVLENMEVDDVVSWNSMIVACVRQGLEKEALTLFKQMHARNMKVDDFTYPSVLNCFAFLMDIQDANSVHCLIIKTGFEAYKLVNNALVDMYAKRGNLDFAFEVFNHMPDKDVVSWTSLVTGYAHNDQFEEALKMYCEMRRLGVCPDQIVVSSILSASAELTVLEFGQQVHANFVKSGLRSSSSVSNSLVTMYMKCGCIEDANRVFDCMQVRDVITWTALIVGYAKNGKGKDSLHFYDQMIASGIKPDFITFIGLLFACSHAGLVESGRSYFESMEKVFGIRPGPEHYACMIDLLGRSGKLAEAKEILNQMVVEPDATVWKALLAACRVHGELALGERAAKNLFELEPMNAVPYVMLSNMYSTAGKWEDAARIRRLMKSKGITKEPGCSWIEVGSRVHTFISEDRGHPRTGEIYAKIDEIMLLIKEEGYEPDMNFALHDMDEEAKQLGLAYHSEKLCIAFGLLTVPSGAPIRIFKNLRVCGDCHSAMKFISRVFVRHVVLRDSNCFHHFREGKCSCGDYW
ncbi:PPR domain-containing protein/PPR_2 domain-containing protein/PPR_3 domain-containing protein/DYW_deaminase domain-containing protein [Cephalotus follicularis]|uniref:PPR domain-containing protein/PPR_2 domain-containing protein/PPR_3 domain-containing protein/DYW_deaminase domain-containing protein n=1 Tax=Cephalotus follicularis TaxID=3775 RepID=A0A1Q3CZF9_CEPFO|nr:PPR domain-containing protein/PPR_2 domain-containing protein/PPR_3 domain-containing protein/DYW_deaminase domain-containing protein [Cephalotus follicularis]